MKFSKNLLLSVALASGLILQFAIIAGPNEDLITAADRGDEARVLAALQAGADINAKDVYGGYTALHRAAMQGRAAVISLLLGHGAKIDNQDSNKDTPLMIAAYYYQAPAVKLLLNHGADTSVINRHGKKAVDMGSHSEIVRMLEERDASLDSDEIV